MKIQRNTSVFWDESVKNNTFDDHKHHIETIKKSLFWKRINKAILDRFGSYNHLKIIELGSGQGLFSMLMAKQGGEVTLLDFSETSLNNAKLFFQKEKVEAKFIKADILNFKDNKKYDVVMSFGVAEHFQDKERFDVQKTHFDLCKPCGMSVIAVPNKSCLFYRVWLFIARITGFFMVEEYAFTMKEFILDYGFDYELVDFVYGSFIASFPRLLSPYRFLNSIVLKRKLKVKEEKSSDFDRFAFEMAFIGYKALK